MLRGKVCLKFWRVSFWFFFFHIFGSLNLTDRAAEIIKRDGNANEYTYILFRHRKTFQIERLPGRTHVQYSMQIHLDSSVGDFVVTMDDRTRTALTYSGPVAPPQLLLGREIEPWIMKFSPISFRSEPREIPSETSPVLTTADWGIRMRQPELFLNRM